MPPRAGGARAGAAAGPTSQRKGLLPRWDTTTLQPGATTWSHHLEQTLPGSGENEADHLINCLNVYATSWWVWQRFHRHLLLQLALAGV